MVAAGPEEGNDGICLALEKEKEKVEQLATYCENTTDVDKIQGLLAVRQELLEMLKDPVPGVSRLAALKSSPLYLECVCKLGQRLAELGEIKPASDLLTSTEPPPTANSKALQQLFTTLK
jgi:hypothetical protein